MIKPGISKFCVSFIKVIKAGLLMPDPVTGKTSNSPANVKCCDVCHNEHFLCHMVCKYRSATYKEYLNERFDVKCKKY